MALDRQKLYNGLFNAYTLGMAGDSSSEDVAGFIAVAIANYASDAEIMLAPGPMIIPGTGVASTSQNAIVKVQTAALGIDDLKEEILKGFIDGDLVMSDMAAGIVEYAATSLILFKGSPAPHTAIGVALMSIPPFLTPSIVIGNVGGLMPAVADSQATAIHTAFLVTIFTGNGTGVDGGLGVVVGPLI